MLLEICKAKLAHGTVTDANLHYEGSITVDEDLLRAANILPGEKVQVLNMNNGQRFDTYTIVGKAGGGEICLNGPAARLGLVGDKVVILSYALMEPQEAQSFKLKVVYLDDKNKVKN